MNNYNMSSTGDNIELVVKYDSDLASMYFEHFERENTRIKMGNGNSDFFLIDGDSSLPIYTKTKLAKMKKQELFDLCGDLDILGNNYIENFTKSELIDELLVVSIKQYYEYLSKIYTWYEIRNHFIHDYYVSNGYSQGDSTYMVKLDGKFTDADEKYCDHVLWDSPVYMNVTINDDEFSTDEFLDDNYDYDTDEITNKINKLDISSYAKEYLIENLPTYPKY